MEKLIIENIPVCKKTVYLNKFENKNSENKIVKKKEVIKSKCIKEIFGADAEILEFSKENIQFDRMKVNWDKIEISRVGDKIYVVNKFDEKYEKPHCCSCFYFCDDFIGRPNKEDFIYFVNHIKSDAKEVLIVTSKHKLKGYFEEYEHEKVDWTSCEYQPVFIEMPYFKWVSSGDNTVADINSAYEYKLELTNKHIHRLHQKIEQLKVEANSYQIKLKDINIQE